MSYKLFQNRECENMISKRVNIGGNYVTVELTDEETREVLDNLRTKNCSELKRCIEQAESVIIGSYELPKSDENLLNVASMLFDKQGTQSYTVLTQALDKKIRVLMDKK